MAISLLAVSPAAQVISSFDVIRVHLIQGAASATAERPNPKPLAAKRKGVIQKPILPPPAAVEQTVEPAVIETPKPLARDRDMALKTDIMQTPTAMTQVAAEGEPESTQTRTISAGGGTGGDGTMLAGGETGSGSKEGSGNHPVMETAIGEPNAPAFIYRKMPVYPKFAERSGWEGNVILKLFIDEQGQLRHVQVVESTWQGFTEAALNAVGKSSFSPGRRNGSTIRSEALLAVRFSMK